MMCPMTCVDSQLLQSDLLSYNSLTMGLKLRLGLALSGLALSSMFGVNMLAGVKDYVDTTGNIMVDIADGIGMVSKVKMR